MALADPRWWWVRSAAAVGQPGMTATASKGRVLTKPKKKAPQMQGFELVPKGGLEPPHYR